MLYTVSMRGVAGGGRLVLKIGGQLTLKRGRWEVCPLKKVENGKLAPNIVGRWEVETPTKDHFNLSSLFVNS